MTMMTEYSVERSAFSAAATAWFSNLRERFTRYRTYRVTLGELEALNARELSDLGLHRSMLRQVAYEAAYGN